MRRRFSFTVCFLGCVMLAGTTNVFAQAQPLPVPSAPATVAQPAQPANDEPIGNVATLTGNATVTRNNAATALKPKDDIFLNDALQTQANSTLGVTFNDATTFNLTANAKITVDSFVYEDGGKKNAALFDIARGTVAFAAAAVAKSGDMKISTPTATMGIRGTTGLVEVPPGTTANSPNNVAIKLYPDADGKVGRIEVNGRDGARLGLLSQGASGFTLRPGAGGRIAAVALAISPQQALRDQGIVRQVHAAQNVGRRVVTEQRALRRANPALNPNRANPPRPGAPQRQNGLPQRQNNLLNRPAAQQAPGLQRQPGVLPAAPGLRRPGLQTPPALQQKKPAAKRLPKNVR